MIGSGGMGEVCRARDTKLARDVAFKMLAYFLVRRAFGTIRKTAEIGPMRIHDLRHTCASLLLAQGVHPRVVMETLGHSQVSLTLDTYSHVGTQPRGGATDGRSAGHPSGFIAAGCRTGCQLRRNVVSRGGIEPPTRRLRVCCSAN